MTIITLITPNTTATVEVNGERYVSEIVHLLGTNIRLWFGDIEFGGQTKLISLPSSVNATGALNFQGHKDLSDRQLALRELAKLQTKFLDAYQRAKSELAKLREARIQFEEYEVVAKRARK